MDITEHVLFKIIEKYTEYFLRNFGATSSIIYDRTKGSYYVSEHFLEVEIIWGDSSYLTKQPDTIFKLANECTSMIADIQEAGGYMVEPLFENRKGKPLMATAIFFHQM